MSTASETTWKADDNPDRFGEELGDEAHIWRVYKDVADVDDKNRVDNWNRGLDNLALFAGLLSAVTSAFLIEARKDLTPDPILETLRSIDARLYNRTYAADGSGTPSDARAVNLFWVASLILSLTAALIAIMGKDWIGMYVKMPSCTLRERADIRTFRLRCVEQWHMSGVISSAPVLLHIALLLFGAGLVVFMALDLATVIFAGLVSGLVFGCYVFLIVHATLSPISPFQSPATQALRRLLILRGLERSPQCSGTATVPLPARPPGEAQSSESEPSKQVVSPPIWNQLWPVSWVERTKPIDVENAQSAGSVHSLRDLAPDPETFAHHPPQVREGRPTPPAKSPKPTDSDDGRADADAQVTPAVVGQHASWGTATEAAPDARGPAVQTGSETHLSETIGTPPALSHWNAIPPVHPDRMLQSLMWLRGASPYAWVECAIITALGDQTIVSGTGDHLAMIPLRDRTSLDVQKGQILGYRVAHCVSDAYVRQAGLHRNEVLLRQSFRGKLPTRIDWSRADLLAVLRYIRLRGNRPGAGMAEPERTQLDALFSDALLDDRVSPEQYIYVVCLAANRGLTIDLSKVQKHCEHIDLALTTASFLMTLLHPPQRSVKPPFDELLVMTKCFGWHRRPADAPMFATVLRTHLPLPASDSAGGVLSPGTFPGVVELLSHIIGHHVVTAYSEALYILLDLLELEPASKKCRCLFDLFDEKKNPSASQAIWTICRKSPAHALSFLNALPLEELDAPDGAAVDLQRLTRNVVVLALSWLVPPSRRFPTLHSHRESIISDITGTRADGITTIGAIFSYSALTHPLTPVDCDWELLATIATYLTDRLATPLPPAEDKDQRSKVESMLHQVKQLVKLLNAVGSDVGGRGTGDGNAFCDLGRLLCDLSTRVAFSAEIARCLRGLDHLRQACDKPLFRDIVAAYPSNKDLIDQWTTIDRGELLFDQGRARIASSSNVRKAAFRGVIVAVKQWRYTMDDEAINRTIDAAVSTECSQLRTLHHENIILFMGVTDTSPFDDKWTVFAWAANDTVKRYIAQCPWADRVQLILGVARGLDYMHSQNPQILHMNVSPWNILVDGTGRAMLGGLSQSIVLMEDKYTAGMWWQSRGRDLPVPATPYSAPETWKEYGHVSSAVDVFAWAMTAVEILSGRRPHAGIKTGAQLTMLVCMGRRPLQDNHSESLGSDAAEILGRFWPLLERGWAQDPNARPSMAAVVEELIRIKDERAQAAAGQFFAPGTSTSGTQESASQRSRYSASASRMHESASQRSSSAASTSETEKSSSHRSSSAASASGPHESALHGPSSAASTSASNLFYGLFED